MKFIDLSHPITEAMPVYPGTQPPVIAPCCSHETEGFMEHKLSMFTHTGTHIDAPLHLFKDGRSLDQFSINHFIGPAIKFQLPPNCSADDQMALFNTRSSELAEADFILIQTNWSDYWGKARYYADFPVLCHEVMSLLIAQAPKGVGLDAISADPVDTTRFENHRRLLENDILIIENLTNLSLLPNSGFSFSCIPLKINNSDGAPVRAVASIET